MSDIESVLTESRLFSPSEQIVAQARISGLAAYQALCAEAASDFEGFWRRLAQEHLTWKRPFNKVLDESNAPFFRWFDDGILNASYNCIDRHLSTQADKTAIVFESDDSKTTRVSYRELYVRVCQMANALKAQGVKKSDRVVIYMPMSIEAVVAMQACARIGATHSVVFGGFSAKSLYERIVDAGAVAIITADEQMRGGKVMPIKAIVDEALALGQCDALKRVIVYQRTDNAINMQEGRDIWLHDALKNQSSECEPEWVEAEHPLFILYTSGSTGAPKGVQHSTGGYLLWALLTMLWTFDLQKKDVFWCTADIGWITGHSYITYGPLAAGGTQVVFEGIPTFPHAGRFWELIDKHQVSIFYTAPTAIRSLIKASDLDKERAHPKNFKLNTLRILGSVGEPINPEAWMWYHKEVGRERCPIMDTWWQTETGGHMLTPLPGATPLKPGSCAFPLPGIMMAVVDETGQEVEKGKGGILVIKRPWPSMIRTIWGNPDRFKSSYFPEDFQGKYYLAGDAAHMDLDGYFWIMGRIDDVLNVSGHRLGTMEIESVLVANPKVAEAAVVGRPDDLTGEAVVAFVVLKGIRPLGEEAKQLATELRNWVGKEIGAIAKPKEIRFGDNLPKTRSGKIMRRLLRSLAKGDAVTQDTSTLENPAILQQLAQSL